MGFEEEKPRMIASSIAVAPCSSLAISSGFSFRAIEFCGQNEAQKKRKVRFELHLDALSEFREMLSQGYEPLPTFNWADIQSNWWAIYG